MATNGVDRNRVERTPGDTNIQKFGFDLQPWVAFIAGGLVLVFIVLTLLFQQEAKAAFEQTQEAIATVGGWWYILVVNLFIGVLLVFAFGKFGRLRLGGPGAQPEFSRFAWFAMLLRGCFKSQGASMA